MAFLPPNEKNEEAPQGVTGVPSGDEPPAQTGGSVGEGSGTGVAGAGPSQGTSTQFGSSSSKLGDYLSANAPQITQQAGNIAGDLNSQFGQMQGNINQGLQNFGQQVQQGYVAPNQGLVNQAATDTQNFVKNPNQVKDFQAQFNNQYKGPQSFESTAPYMNMQNDVNTAIQNSGRLNTSAGLQDYFAQKGGNQTAASNTLDTLLVQGTPEARQTVQNASGQFNNLTGQLGQAKETGNQQVSAAQKAADDARSYARNAITGDSGTLTNLNKDVTGAAQQRLTEAQKQQSDINAALTGLYGGRAPDKSPTAGYDIVDLSPEVKASLGLDDTEWGNLRKQIDRAGHTEWMTGHNFGMESPTTQIDLTQYLQQQNPADYINAGNVANSDQYALMGALQQLLGSDFTGGAIDPSQAGLAGTAPTNLNQFNYDAALSGTQNIADSARQMAQQVANDATAKADAEHEASKHKGILNTVKNVVSNPMDVLTRHMDPRNVWEDIQQTYKNPGTVPGFGGDTPFNPLPDNQEKAKLGIK